MAVIRLAKLQADIWDMPDDEKSRLGCVTRLGR